MRFGDVLNEMMSTDTPKVAVNRSFPFPSYITIVRPSEADAPIFVQLYNGTSYGHISSRELLSDQWEWA